MYGSQIRYIGDISREDAELLARTAAGARRILEFGAGASTQVLAQSASEGAEIVTVETKPDWVERTRANLRRLGIRREVRFVPYRGFWRSVQGPFEMIFDDGIDRLRAEFAERAWPMPLFLCSGSTTNRSIEATRPPSRSCGRCESVSTAKTLP